MDLTKALRATAIKSPILVIAPHPDDETLGCGGLIAMVSSEGQPLHVVFVTDGGASHPNSREWSRQRLSGRRETEAAEALGRLGAGHQPRTFLRLRDADMPQPESSAYAEAMGDLVTIIRDLQPRLVVLPWRRDPHCDHQASWQLAMDAIAAANLSSETWEYAIWLDAFGRPEDRPRPGEMKEVRLEIASALAAKRHAIEAHRSQLGKLVVDDPSGFVLDRGTIARLSGSEEVYWRPCAAR